MKMKHLGTLIILASLTAPQLSFAGTKVATPTIPTKLETEKRVREYFKDIPVMIEIARCESNFRQYTDAGNPLRGGASGGMVGVFQFFESIHSAGALALGYDITTLEGNLAYARHVYNAQGTTPWDPAKGCWDVKPLTTATVTAKDPAALRAQIKQLTELIMQLQKRLSAQKNRQK
ncbi:MAG: hypothetical protein RLZZ480_61 [Candidatus Parcubacteria bacterium]|jgi:hypothetical protein